MTPATRWLHACLALLALLGGGPLHHALHAHGEHGVASGALEVHDGDCEHLADAPTGHDTCPACSARVQLDDVGTHAEPWLPERTPRPAAREHDDPAPSLPRAGPLGARGPPTTNG